jgi:hypothetical protein
VRAVSVVDLELAMTAAITYTKGLTRPLINEYAQAA